jgi:putative transposase
MIRNLKFRIYPTKKQTTQLINCLEESRYVYNLLLEKRKIEWESNRKSIHVYEQINCLPEIKLDRPSVKVVYSQCLQNIAVRIDLAYQAFFRNLKKDPQKAGLPRPKDKGKYSSITFPQYNSGCKIINNKLRLFKIGDVHIKLHRKIENIKTITIKYEPTGKWFAIIACDVESVRKGGKQKTVGIDLGTMTFATLSDEEEIKNPRFLDRALK